jgi:CMP-N-acetylneuraminic acid synthetase
MLSNKRILAVVPARGGSKGIKLKNLSKINGISLVEYACRIISELLYIDRAVVSTDHPEIRQVAVKAGIDAPFIRPEKLSGDIVADIDVLTHALLATEKDDGQHYDIIVMLQPTSPMRKPEHVTRTVTKLINEKYDAVWTISETDSKSHPLKQLVFDNDLLDYYDLSGADIIARQQLSPVYHRNGAVYAISRNCLLHKQSIKGQRTSAVIIKTPLVNIDTEFDLQLAEFLTRVN